MTFRVGVATSAVSSRISTVSEAILTPARVRKSKVVWTGPVLSRGSVITRLSRSPKATAQALEADPDADTSAPADRRLDGGRPDTTTEPSGSNSGSARSACCSTDAVATGADRRSGSGRDGGRGSKASIAGRSQSRARELTSVYGSSGSAMRWFGRRDRFSLLSYRSHRLYRQYEPTTQRRQHTSEKNKFRIAREASEKTSPGPLRHARRQSEGGEVLDQRLRPNAGGALKCGA